MNKFNMAYDTELLQDGIRYYATWDYQRFPHLLVLGNTGSGKTYFIKILLGRVAIHAPKSQIFVCDFKNDDFKFLEGAPRYYGYKGVQAGFNEFYSLLEKRIGGDESREFRLLLIDEYVSWLSSLDKKESDDIKKRMASLVFLARALNLHIILGCQRGMAETFSYGSRDCLNIIFLGAPSKESIRSFCSSDDAELIKPCGRGAGYAVFDGKPPRAITVPTVNDMDKLHRAILQAVTR